MVRGFIEVYTQSEGWIEIELGDPADLDRPIIEVYTPSGWAAPMLVDPADADTPIEVYTQSYGWLGVQRQLQRLIDDYERGDLSPYTDRSDTGTSAVVGRAARSGSYGLELSGESAVWSVPGSGLDNYPDPSSDQFEFYFNIQSHDQVWTFFGGTTDADQDRYQVEAIDDGDFRIRIDQGGSRSVLDYLGSGAISWSTGTWYRGLVTPHSGDGFDVDLYGGGNHLGNLSTNDATFTGPGKFGARSSNNATAYWDDAAILP